MVRIHFPLPKRFHAGVVQLDQDTRLRTERLEGSSPSARTILRPLVQGTGHSPPEAGIGVRVAGGRPSSRGRPTGEVPGCLPGSGGFDSRSARQSYVVERDRTSALTLTQVIVGSIPTYDATGQSTTGRVPSLSKR